MAFIYIGGTCVIMKAYKTADMIETIERHKITVLFNVPTMYVLMLINETLNEKDVSLVRLAAYGGAPMDKETIIQLKSRLGVDLYNAYGLTESSSLGTVLPACDAVRKAPSVGLPVPGLQLKAVDPQGREVPAGDPGELLMKGPNIVKGYYKNPEATEKGLVDGWLYTGTLPGSTRKASLYRGSDEGYDRPRRGKYLLHRGRIGPESTRRSWSRQWFPNHTTSSASGRACLVLCPETEATPEEILDYCRQHLADFKVPARIGFLSESPRNPGGKVVKNKLREIKE